MRAETMDVVSIMEEETAASLFSTRTVDVEEIPDRDWQFHYAAGRDFALASTVSTEVTIPIRIALNETAASEEGRFAVESTRQPNHFEESEGHYLQEEAEIYEPVVKMPPKNEYQVKIKVNSIERGRPSVADVDDCWLDVEV
jgi:hypothetical protein